MLFTGRRLTLTQGVSMLFVSVDVCQRPTKHSKNVQKVARMSGADTEAGGTV